MYTFAIFCNHEKFIIATWSRLLIKVFVTNTKRQPSQTYVIEFKNMFIYKFNPILSKNEKKNRVFTWKWAIPDCSVLTQTPYLASGIIHAWVGVYLLIYVNTRPCVCFSVSSERRGRRLLALNRRMFYEWCFCCRNSFALRNCGTLDLWKWI